MKKSFIAVVLGMVAVLGITPAYASIVTNGGFETGDLTGWTVNDPGVFVAPTMWANSGYYAADFTSQNTLGSLTQFIPTVVGTTYELSYYLRSAGGTNTFSTIVGGNTILFLQNFGQDYVYYDQFFTATSDLTELTFASQQEFGAYLDDVDVVPAPEPVTFVLVGAGLFGAGFMRRKIRS